jgi:bifunctional DNase/RNase
MKKVGSGCYHSLMLVELKIPSNVPVLMLKESEGKLRELPIFIGGPEASAIHYALEGIVPERPLTHDLLVSVVSEMGGTIEKIVLTDVVEHTYFAEIEIAVKGSTNRISARPSDAVAIAVRVGAPIFAESALMDAAAKEPSVVQPDDEEGILDDFRQFINSINPEDFQG